MTTITFDTLRYANRLKAAGVPSEQAEALAEVFQNNLKELATRGDLNLLQQALKADISQIKADMVQLEQRMTIKLGSLMVVAIGVVATLVSVL